MVEKKISILGTDYKVVFDEPYNENEEFQNRKCCGYCNSAKKEIHVCDFQDSVAPEIEKAETMRHEIIHAYIAESGLGSECPWAYNEEMIDWFAIQLPKLQKTFNELEL